MRANVCSSPLSWAARLKAGVSAWLTEERSICKAVPNWYASEYIPRLLSPTKRSNISLSDMLKVQWAAKCGMRGRPYLSAGSRGTPCGCPVGEGGGSFGEVGECGGS